MSAPEDGFLYIGLGSETADDMVTVDSLGIATANFQFDPAAVAETVRNGSGFEVPIGYPTTEWHLNFILRAQYDALQAFAVGGRSSEVYIQTYDEDGLWATYFCIMHWPLKIKWTESGIGLDFSLLFTHMVKQ